jgi:NAD(P) transhydrogenase subunit beta
MLAYLVAGVCFILALRGLSSPSTSRRGNRFGMLGMAIAVAPRFSPIPDRLDRDRRRDRHRRRDRLRHRAQDRDDRDAAARRRLPQPGRPRRRAGRGRRLSQPGRVRHLDPAGRDLPAVSRIEMGLGIAIGAITFSGSVIAFLKLNGNMSGKPIMLPGRHVINLGTLAAIIGLIGLFPARSRAMGVLDDHRPELRDRLPADHPDRRRGHAGRRLDAQQLFGLGGGGDGLHAAQHRDDHHRRAGRHRRARS